MFNNDLTKRWGKRLVVHGTWSSNKLRWPNYMTFSSSRKYHQDDMPCEPSFLEIDSRGCLAAFSWNPLCMGIEYQCYHITLKTLLWYNRQGNNSSTTNEVLHITVFWRNSKGPAFSCKHPNAELIMSSPMFKLDEIGGKNLGKCIIPAQLGQFSTSPCYTARTVKSLIQDAPNPKT